MAKEVTRKKLLDAAEKLFAKDGFDGVPTKKIAAEAGITEMTLFNHFSTKELLYKTVVKERYLSINITSEEIGLTFDNLERDLKKLSAALLSNFVDNKRVLMMRLKEKRSFQDDETFSLEKDPLLIQIIPLFEAYEKTEVLSFSAGKSALLFMASFKGLCHLCLLENRNREKTKNLTDDFITTFCRGIIKQK